MSELLEKFDLAFITVQRYRTLADRLMSMKLVPVQRFSSRQVSYEFMNRQMVWHAFTVSVANIIYICGLISCKGILALGPSSF